MSYPKQLTWRERETEDEAMSSFTTGEREIDDLAATDTDVAPSTSNASQDPSETVRTLQKRLSHGEMTTTIKDDSQLSAPQHSKKHISPMP